MFTSTFDVGWIKLSFSFSLSLSKKKESNLDIAQFYTLSYNSNPNKFRPRCIPPTPEITAKQSDSTRRFNPPRAPLTDLFNRVEKRNNPRYNVTREKETVRRERWERKHDDTSRKLKRRIMGGISRRRAFEIITRYIKFVRGASQTMTAHKISNPSPSLFFSPFAPMQICLRLAPHCCKFNTLIARPFAGQSFLHRSPVPCNQLGKCACINAGYTSDRSVQFTSTHSMTYNRAC